MRRVFFPCLLGLVACGETVKTMDAAVMDAPVDNTPLVPRAITCKAPPVGGSDAGDTKECAAGQYCVSFQGGVADCRALSDACKQNPTCACKPMLPNATCNCSDDGQGRIIVDCH